jgi:hypothetical protein
VVALRHRLVKNRPFFEVILFQRGDLLEIIREHARSREPCHTSADDDSMPSKLADHEFTESRRRYCLNHTPSATPRPVGWRSVRPPDCAPIAVQNAISAHQSRCRPKE